MADQSTQPAADPAPAYVPASTGGPTVASLATGSTLQPTSGFYVQTGAFTTQENAERQRGAVSSYGAIGEFLKPRPADATSIACAWDLTQLQMPPALSPTG